MRLSLPHLPVLAFLLFGAVTISGCDEAATYPLGARLPDGILTEAEVNAALAVHLAHPGPTSLEEAVRQTETAYGMTHPFVSFANRFIEAPIDAPSLRAIRERAAEAVGELGGHPAHIARLGTEHIGLFALSVVLPRTAPTVDDADRLYFVGLALDGMSPEFPRITEVLASVEGHEREVRALARRALLNLAVLERAAERAERAAEVEAARLVQAGQLTEAQAEEDLASMRAWWHPLVTSPHSGERGPLDVERARAGLAALAR